MTLACHLVVPRYPGSADHHHALLQHGLLFLRSYKLSIPQERAGRAHGCIPHLSLPVRGVDKNDILRESVIGDEDVVQLVIYSFPGNLETPRCPHKETQHPGL